MNNPYEMSLKDKLFAVATSSNGDGRAALSAKGDRRAKAQAWEQQQQAAAQAKAQAAQAQKYEQAAHIAKSLRDAQSPDDRNTILDYYVANVPDGFNPQDFERFRDAPDALLDSVYNRALSVKERLAQDNTAATHGLAVRKQGATEANDMRDDERAQAKQDFDIEDGRFDNQINRETLDNTVRNTESLIQDRGVDNQRMQAALDETVRSNAAGEAQSSKELEMKAAAANSARPKPFADAQAKAATFGHRADQSNAELEALVADGLNPSGMFIGGVATSQNRRQYDRAKREFVNAVLRQESGAAIGKDEFKNADRQYFPQFGDSEATMAQKKQARERAADGLKRQSQGAYDALYGDISETAAVEPAAGVLAPPSGFVLD